MDNEWKLYLQHGEEFYKAAKGGYDYPEKFNVDTLFNLAAMSIEKTSMGFLMMNNHMPRSHSFEHLVESLNSFAQLPEDLEEGIKGLDAHQENFCSLEIFRPAPITREDIPPMIEICEKLQTHISKNMSQAAS